MRQPSLLRGSTPFTSKYKVILNKLLVVEGNIFKACSVSWTPFKGVLLKELCDDAFKLEEYISPRVIS